MKKPPTTNRVLGYRDETNVLTVEPMEATVKHKVEMNDFQKWLDRGRHHTNEMTERKRISAILESVK